MSMRMSEATAQSKWCPHVLVGGGGQSATNNRRFFCLGTSCMEWQGDKTFGYCNIKDRK